MLERIRMAKCWLLAVLIVSVSCLQVGYTKALAEEKDGNAASEVGDASEVSAVGDADADATNKALIVVAPEQTLWRVAVNNTLSGTNPWQVLMAIYQANPEAFKDGHIGQIITGSKLRMPHLAQIQSLSAKQAEAAYQQLIDQAQETATAAYTENEPTAIILRADPIAPAQSTVSPAPALNLEVPSVASRQLWSDLDLSLLLRQVDSIQQQLQAQQAQLRSVTMEVQALRQVTRQQEPELTAFSQITAATGDSILAKLDITLAHIWSILISSAFYPWVVATLCLLVIIILLVILLVLWLSVKLKQTTQIKRHEALLAQTTSDDLENIEGVKNIESVESTGSIESSETIDPTRSQQVYHGTSHLDQAQHRHQNQNKVLSEAELIAQLLQDKDTASSSDDSAADSSLTAAVDRLLKQDETAQNMHEPQQVSSIEDAVLSKLDLARSYKQMGHHEQARTLLQEVLHEGNLQQQREATLLLSAMYQE